MWCSHLMDGNGFKELPQFFRGMMGLLLALVTVVPAAWGQDIDLDMDGVADFILQKRQRIESDWVSETRLVPQRSNSVWVAKPWGQPFLFPQAGEVWSATNSPAGMWSEPGARFLFLEFGNERRYGSDDVSFIQEGLLGTDSLEQDPTAYVLVRFADTNTWRLAWIQFNRFQNYRLNPNQTTVSSPPSMFPEDIGVYPGPEPESWVIGEKAPNRDQRLRITVVRPPEPWSQKTSLLIETEPEGLGDTLEWSLDPDAGPWTPMFRLIRGSLNISTGGLYGIPETSTVFFRLK